MQRTDAGFSKLEEEGIHAVHKLERELHRWITEVLLPKVASIEDLDRRAKKERETLPQGTPRAGPWLTPQDQWRLRQGPIYLQGWDAHRGLVDLIAAMERYLTTNYLVRG